MVLTHLSDWHSSSCAQSAPDSLSHGLVWPVTMMKWSPPLSMTVVTSPSLCRWPPFKWQENQVEEPNLIRLICINCIEKICLYQNWFNKEFYFVCIKEMNWIKDVVTGKDLLSCLSPSLWYNRSTSPKRDTEPNQWHEKSWSTLFGHHRCCCWTRNNNVDVLFQFSPFVCNFISFSYQLIWSIDKRDQDGDKEVSLMLSIFSLINKSFLYWYKYRKKMKNAFITYQSFTSR